jgi:acyl-CoA thioester hydrolase
MNVAADGWYERSVEVRFRDLDSMGHAHHTLPLIYLEEARAAFWRELKGTADPASIDYVMAEITLRFHARILYPSTLTVRLSVSRVGSKSFGTDFEVRGADGALLSAGSAVQVAFDYGRGSAKQIDAADRAVLERWRAARQKSSAMPADTMPMSPPST